MRKIIILIVLFAAVIIVSVVIYNTVTEKVNYKAAIDRQVDIGGSWTFDTHNFLSIDDNKSPATFMLMKDNVVIKQGKVEKTEENYFLLYDKNTNNLYAKIIPSYQKIYLIEQELGIREFKFFDEGLVTAP